FFVLCPVRRFFFFSSRRRHTRSKRDWSSDVCSSDLNHLASSLGWINYVFRQLPSSLNRYNYRPMAPVSFLASEVQVLTFFLVLVSVFSRKFSRYLPSLLERRFFVVKPCQDVRPANIHLELLLIQQAWHLLQSLNPPLV